MALLGKVLMSLAIAAFTFVPPIVDLVTDTHVFHPGWLPHARMHTVWLLGVSSGVGLVALALLWSPGPPLSSRIHLAGILGAIVFGAFFLSASTISLYGGALSDTSGGVEAGPFGIDANLFTFTAASTLLVVGWWMSARATAPQD